MNALHSPPSRRREIFGLRPCRTLLRGVGLRIHLKITSRPHHMDVHATRKSEISPDSPGRSAANGRFPTCPSHEIGCQGQIFSLPGKEGIFLGSRHPAPLVTAPPPIPADRKDIPRNPSVPVPGTMPRVLKLDFGGVMSTTRPEDRPCRCFHFQLTSNLDAGIAALAR